MTEQEFYEYIAKNHASIHKHAMNYIQRLAQTDAWNQEGGYWESDFDEWDAFDENTDLNFWVNTEYSDPRETTGRTEMWVTAYLYHDYQVQTDIYVNICKLEGKSE